jgi:glycosyltransferase involved in cell wall biosynthesis
VRRPKVALVVASLEILGGHGVQATALARRLQDEGYEVSFVHVNPPFRPHLRWIQRVRYLRTLVNQAIYLPSLRRLSEVDVVHVFAASYWSFLLAPAPAILAARRYRKRIVLNYHSGEAGDHLARWGELVHPFLRLADHIVVPSEYLREVFGRHGYRARVIPNVVDLSRFRYRERAPLGRRLLSARNLEPCYRVEDIVEAHALLKPRYRDARLTIAGCGGEERRLRRLASSLGADGIEFVGRVEPTAMPTLYAATDIFVNTSIIDNQPLSVLEAFAAGLPVVSTGPGDLSAMVKDGQTGLLVPPRDPVAVAKAVTMLLEEPQRALAMARRARRQVEAHTWPHVRDKWAAVYGEAGA